MATDENKPRLQLSLRFDSRPELLGRIKARATELNIKLVDFIASALENSLQSGFHPADKRQDNDKIQALEAKVEALGLQNFTTCPILRVSRLTPVYFCSRHG